ncbi:MAG: hypothetical protein RLN62_05395 [Rickettsiales bacterium]
MPPEIDLFEAFGFGEFGFAPIENDLLGAAPPLTEEVLRDTLGDNLFDAIMQFGESLAG